MKASNSSNSRSIEHDLLLSQFVRLIKYMNRLLYMQYSGLAERLHGAAGMQANLGVDALKYDPCLNATAAISSRHVLSFHFISFHFIYLFQHNKLRKN